MLMFKLRIVHIRLGFCVQIVSHPNRPGSEVFGIISAIEGGKALLLIQPPI